MAKKKRGDAHGGGHGWFVTFADLMALLLAFFVMLVAFSTQDANKLKIVAGSMREAFGVQRPDVQALALPAERGSAWTLLYPQYSVVVPSGMRVRMPLAYAVGARDAAFASFVNTWIELKQKDGTVQALYDYWILGRSADRPAPRWSIVRNVLHWVD